MLTALVMLVRTIATTRPEAMDRLTPHLDAILAEAERADLLAPDFERVAVMIRRARRDCEELRADAPPDPNEPDLD